MKNPQFTAAPAASVVATDTDNVSSWPDRMEAPAPVSAAETPATRQMGVTTMEGKPK
jgi:hypothetical protein